MTDRDAKICAALISAAEDTARKAIEHDPQNAVLYMKRLAEYQPKKSD